MTTLHEIRVQGHLDERWADTTMQAIVQDTYGSAEVLQLREIDTPVIGDDDVLVRVHAAGVHIGDVHLMTGMPYLMRSMGFGLRAPGSASSPCRSPGPSVRT